MLQFHNYLEGVISRTNKIFTVVHDEKGTYKGTINATSNNMAE
jgi:hypothetical protein